MENKKYPAFPILIVDDEAEVLASYKSMLKFNGYDNLILCADSRDVKRIIGSITISVILLDLFMPHITGEELLEEIVKNNPEVPVIVITGSNKVETAVSCMKNGAFDYMIKPVEDCRLITSVKRGLEIRNLTSENEMLKSYIFGNQLKYPECFKEIITKNIKMLSIFNYLEAISYSTKPVLITGESGTGKELIARSIHYLSCKTGVRNNNFVSVNAAGLDDTLFSDTLFGHEKGAFTGATAKRAGLIEKAKSGTLFLDEIGDLEMSSQVKLLRLLQEMEYYSLGSDVPMISGARIITASNINLKKKQEEGGFRKDLFYRLNIHRIEIPPLRERKEDIPDLVKYFVKEACLNFKKEEPEIPEEVMSVFKAYSFPGNIRELESIIFDITGRASSDCMERSDIINYFNSQGIKLDDNYNNKERGSSIYFDGDFPTMNMVEEYFINEAMKRTNNNQTAAAKLLDISQSTLSKRFKRKGENI